MTSTIIYVLCVCFVLKVTIAEDALLLNKYQNEFFKLEDALWNDINEGRYASKESISDVTLIRQFEKFSDKLVQDFPVEFFGGTEYLNDLWIWARASAEIRSIKALYGTFRRFQAQQSKPGRVPSPQQAWIDMTETILNDSKSSVVDSINNLDTYVTKNKLFSQAWQEIEGDMRCNIQQSPQQVLFNLYNTITLAELKGYTMVQFSYMLLKLYKKGNFKRESELAKQRYQERNEATIKAIKNVMQQASKELWKCDPRKHIPGETYVEITQLLQGYIQNEVDLNEDGTCRETCTEYSYTKSHSCYQNLWCRQQKKCEGRVINCQYIDADMWICPAGTFSGKRYEYVEYENGRVLGRNLGCKNGKTKVDSWWRWLFWRCSYCFCLCDDPSESDRYINLRAYVSDIENNKVVTGLRFVKKNRIIHLQIQEGELISRANIDNTTLRWIPVDDYHVTDRNVLNKQDFHTLTWEERSLDLDDLIADDNHVVTGVRFKRLGTHINFEIKITPFNFTTGKLIDPINRSMWKDNDNTDSSYGNPRTEVRLRKPDIPTRSSLPSIPSSKNDQYIKFTNSDMDRDAAQTTVPFIDAQPVTSLTPVPLIGAGIFYKGRDFFGGFITPKIITYDFSKHLIPNN